MEQLRTYDIKNTNHIMMNVYKTNTDYIGKFNISESHFKSEISKYNKINYKDSNILLSSYIETFVILDRSASMGSSVSRLYNKIIPSMLRKLGYSNLDNIHVITFDSGVNVYNVNIKKMEKQFMDSRGSTNMKKAISSLKNILDKSEKKCVRILAISDGELNDQIETLQESSLISDNIKSKFQINSNAVRFFTSESEPSTKGLSSILQFNTKFNSSLVDISASKVKDEELTSILSSLFEKDNFNSIGSLKPMTLKYNKKEKILKMRVWKAPSSEISNLSVGENTVWLTTLIDNSKKDLVVQIGNDIYPVYIKEELKFSSDEFFNNIFKNQISYYFNQIKLLKIINTQKSVEEINKILEMFKNLDESFSQKESNLNNTVNTTLSSRLTNIRSSIIKRSKSIYYKFQELSNDDKVNKLNSAQQADYLRNTELNKNSKALARRAFTEGIDFNTIAREEVRNMRLHFNELENIDDSNHLISFYSTCTTLDGIKSVCELVDNDLIDDANVNDIIKLLNIVGIGCDSIIGDFPDPMTWRVKKLFSGCYISISDILVGYEASNGKSLVDVGTKQPITNSIPIFENNVIHKFILKYAPKLVEYTCSIGMRRIIADIPKTYIYTLLTGITNLIETLNIDRSEVTVKTFCCLLKSFEITIGNAFKYLGDYLVDQDTKLSYYISNNGYSNMISPLIDLIKSYYKKNDINDDVYEIKNIDRIIRALYCFEIYQIIKRIIKGDNPSLAAKELLNELLCIDIDKDATPLPNLFEESINPIYHSEYNINKTKLSEIFNKIFYVDYMVLAPYMIKCAYINELKTNSVNKETNSYDYVDELNYIKAIPTFEMRSTETDYIKFSNFASEKLKIDYNDINKFKFYNIIQALLYNTKSSRVDSVNEKMLITELNYEKVCEKLVKDYVQDFHQQRYLIKLNEKNKKEKEILTNELVRKMIETEDIEEFAMLLKNGLKKNHVHVVISDTSKIGFSNLHNQLINKNINVPDRLNKSLIVLAGTYKDQIIWNGGNALKAKALKDYVDFYKANYHEDWNSAYYDILLKTMHLYRKNENRHGHNNDKPSYWAFGHEQLLNYKKEISNEEFEEYVKVHYNCCGVPRIIKKLPEEEIKSIYREKREKKKMSRFGDMYNKKFKKSYFKQMNKKKKEY